MAALALALTPAAAVPALADPPPPSTYREAVQEAYDLTRNAVPGDNAPAVRAAAVLEAASGQSLQEILGDLQRRPPDYQDAAERLSALLAALDRPASTADPALAHQRMHDVMAMNRYDPLHRPPTLLERFVQWVRDRVADLLRFITGNGAGGVAPGILFYLAGAAALIAVAVVIFRSTRGRFSQALSSSRPPGPRPPADYFTEADRLAGGGDRVGAIRALCAGVAATLAGERTWEGSPLTVREIFQRAPDAAGLRPLLLPFEAAIYGGREVDEETYRRAELVAAPYRDPREAAA
ncbi:MAG: hypothetical protein WCC30_09895 [Candidatus Dormiibacterota bacterium]